MSKYFITLEQLKELAKIDASYVLCRKIHKEQKLITERTESLTKGLVGAFIVFDAHYTGKPLHLQDVPLTKNQYNNFQKLSYHGLVKNTSTGYWDMTELGKYFLSGSPVSKNVTVDNGSVIARSPHKTTLSKITNTHSTPFYQTRQSYLD